MPLVADPRAFVYHDSSAIRVACGCPRESKVEPAPLRVITRYVLREFLLFFLLALVATSSILILRQIFLLTKRFVSKDISLWYLAELLVYALPSVLALTIPMAVLAGMLMVLGQFAFTGEITAMRASGMGIHRLLLPVAVVGCVFAATDYWMMDGGLPWGNRHYIDLYLELSRKSPALVLEEGVVMRSMEGDERLWYFERMEPKTKRLRNIRIWEGYRDGRPRLTTAREASLSLMNGNSVLTLYDGVSYEPGERDEDVLAIRFPTQEMTLNIGDQFARSGGTYKIYRTMDSGTLRQEIRDLRAELASAPDASARSVRLSLGRASMELHKKYSIPFACIAFALASVPLGIVTRRSGFMMGMAIGLPLIIVYYTLLRVGETLGERAMIHPVVGAWLPNVPILVIGVAAGLWTLRR